MTGAAARTEAVTGFVPAGVGSTIRDLVDQALVEVPETWIVGGCAVFALILFGFGIGVSYGIFMELSEKQRWGKYFANDVFFQSMHCVHCALGGGGSADSDASPDGAHARGATDAGRTPLDGGAVIA